MVSALTSNPAAFRAHGLRRYAYMRLAGTSTELPCARLVIWVEGIDNVIAHLAGRLGLTAIARAHTPTQKPRVAAVSIADGQVRVHGPRGGRPFLVFDDVDDKWEEAARAQHEIGVIVSWEPDDSRLIYATNDGTWLSGVLPVR
jgi:hypothetical protein